MWICPVCQKENIDNAHVCIACNQGKLCYSCSNTFSGDVCSSCGKDYSTPIWLTEEQYADYIAPATQAIEDKEEPENVEVTEDENKIIESVETDEEIEEVTEEITEETNEEKTPEKKSKGRKVLFTILAVAVICVLIFGYIRYRGVMVNSQNISNEVDSSSSLSDATIDSSALSDATIDSSASSDASFLSDALSE